MKDIDVLNKEYFSNWKNFRDPVHGDIKVYKYETAIVNTRAFQRLRGIKQLGASELVWMGATHNRFQHSIGTLAMAQRMIDSLIEEASINPAQRIIIRLFALLHDIGHVPFGHTIEDERPVIGEKHYSYSRVQRIFSGEIESSLKEIDKLFTKNIWKNIGIYEINNKNINQLSLIKLILFLITSDSGETVPDNERSTIPEKYSLYFDMVGNTVCADLFDYLLRDTYYTGLRRSYDEKIFSHLVIKNGGLVIDLGLPKRYEERSTVRIRTRGGIITEISNLLRVRYTLTERVYFNDTKSAASAMISQAIGLSGIDLKLLSEMRDEELLDYLEGKSRHIGIKIKASDKKKYHNLLEKDKKYFSDLFSPGGEKVFSLWKHISSRQQKTLNMEDLTKKLINAYRRRNIFKPVYRISGIPKDTRIFLCKYLHNYDNKNFRMDLEYWLAEMCSLEAWQVIIYCPAHTMNVKVAETPVGPLPGGVFKRMDQLDDSDVNGNEALKILKKEADSLQKHHEVLWSMEVLVDEEADEEKKRFLATCSSALFFFSNKSPLDIGDVAFDSVLINNLKKACDCLNKKFSANLVEKLIHQPSTDRKKAYTISEFIEVLQKTAGP